MTALFASDLDNAMLLLGRLDGRLHNSMCADIFLARARLEGAAALASLAGVPVAVAALQNWIAGRTAPPRASEGLNDPISVAAIFHFAISRDEDMRDPILRATRNVLRSVLDDRTEAEMWAGDDLAHFGPAWRAIHAMSDQPMSGHGLPAIARRIFDMAAHIATAEKGSAVIAIDGRTLQLPTRDRDHGWLIATALPRLLVRADLTTRIIPSLILMPRLLPATPDALADMLRAALHQAAQSGLRDLDQIERAAQHLRTTSTATKRSRAPLLARLQLAYPGLHPRAVAKLLGVTPQGARKLLGAAQS